MSTARRRLGVAALTATAALVASQTVAMSVASARTAGLSGGANKASVTTSQTPYQVRDHSAKLTGRLAGTQHVRLAIGLTTRDAAGQDAFNAAVQDRKSPLFHKYLTAAQWNARFGPTASDEAAVVKWAQQNGLTVSKRWSNRLLVDIDSPASAIEKAFKVNLNKYALNGKTFFSNDVDPSLPSSVKSLVSSVEGLNNIQVLQSGATSTAKMPMYSAGPTSQQQAAVHANGSMKALKAALAQRKAHPHITGGYYDPTDLYSSYAYDVNAEQATSPCCNPFHNPTTGSPAQTSIAVITAGKHDFSNDLTAFHNRYTYLALNVNEQYIDGTPGSFDFEGTMDTEWSLAMANSFGCYCDTSHIYVYSGVNAAFTTFSDMYNKVLTDNVAKNVTSSWGCAEFYCYGDATMNSDHNIFNSMTAQGFTMVNSSNDKGPYADCAHLSVHFPASDPNWLAIGGTTLQTSTSGFSSETAWTGGSSAGSCANNNGGGGGGCSAKWAAPSWQSGIASVCGSSSRALPDVSLNASVGQNTYYLGSWYGGGGTSISAPMMGGMFARENSYLLSLGSICGLGTGTSPCAPIGMPGREVYDAGVSHSAGRNPYYDITSGCTSNDIGGGWCAGTGYDRATGWGSVNMLQYAWALNYWTVAEASAPTVSMSGGSTSGWTSTPISYAVTDNGGSYAASGIAGVTAQWDSVPDNTLTHATPGAGDSFYSGPASHTTSATTSLTGCHTLYVRAWDNIGLSTLNSYGECFDNVAPTVGVASYDINRNTTLQNDGSANIHIQWSGSDATSGIAQYLLYREQDSSGYSLVLSGVTRTHDDEYLAPGHTYTFAVGAYDNAGNFSGYAYSTVTVNTYDQFDGSVNYTTNGWYNQAVAGSYLGKVKYSSLLNKRATFSFNGYDVAFVTTKGAAYGNVSLKLDGGAPFYANDNASSTSTRQLTYKSGVVSSGAHALEVRNQGTAGHPRVDIDAFVVLS